MNIRTTATRALTALQLRDNEDAFVIFEHQPNKKFVQFSGGLGVSLCIDLPSQTLSESEFALAEVFFRELGVEAQKDEIFDFEGNSAGHQISFSKLFDSIEEAADVTTRVFERVFGIPQESDFVITEN